DELVRRSLARLVRSAGYPVETFSSPRDLLVRAQPVWAGCIVLDLLMPDLDGLQAQEMFVREGLRLPVIFISGHGDIPTSVRAMKAGAIDFLVKPTDAGALLLAIERAIARDEASQRL